MRIVAFIRARLWLLLAILSVGIAGPQARGQGVQAHVSATTIGTEEAVSYTIEISGAQVSDVEIPQPPETDGLQILQTTPSTQTNVSFVNGNVTRTIGYQWNFRPTRTGTVQFLPASITVDDNTHAFDAISVTVVPQSQRPARRTQRRSPFDLFGDEPAPATIGTDDVFVRAVPSASSAYQNEQVTIAYEMYFRANMQPRNSRLADSWDAEGFWREELDVETRPMPQTRVENGLRYNVIILKRVAVFPTRTGALTVDPLRIETEVLAPRRGNPFSQPFFSLRNIYETIQRGSQPVAIDSRPLPPGAPEHFTGAVGDYTLHAELSQSEVDVGEPIQLTVRISGQGNLATLDEPELSLPGIFEQYEPEVSTSIDNKGAGVRGSKTFTYLLVPRSNGTFDIAPVEFSYFDPDEEVYRTLRSDPFTLRATGVAPEAIAAPMTPTGFPVDDIASPLPATRWIRYPQSSLHRQAWPYVVLAIPLLLIGVVAVLRRRATRLATDTAYSRTRRAHPLARKHLKTAVALKRQDEPRAFYEELEQAVRGFVGNRLNIAELGFTRPQLDEHLASIGLDEALRCALLALLEECDAARFAPARSQPAEMESSLQAAHTLIADLDGAFRTKGL